MAFQVFALGAGLLLVINGSPYERNKDDVRLALCARRAQEAGAALAYVNMVGGQDDGVLAGSARGTADDHRLHAVDIRDIDRVALRRDVERQAEEELNSQNDLNQLWRQTCQLNLGFN